MDELDKLRAALSGDDMGALGDLGDDDVGALGDLGSALAGASDEAVGAAVKHVAKRQKQGRPVTVQEVKKIVMAYNRSGFNLLSPDVKTPSGAFGMEGSLCVLSFAGTVPAAIGGVASTLPITVNIDRETAVREMHATRASGDLQVTNFVAGGLPFTALQFPYSLEDFTNVVLNRKIRAQTFPAQTKFVLTLSNPTGQAILGLITCWGTAQN